MCFADLCGILQKNTDNFFPQVFYIKLNVKPFFSNPRKKSTGSTGNTDTWNTLVLEINNFLKYLRYSALEMPVLEIPDK